MQLTGHLCPIQEVSPRDIDQMFALMQRYYEKVDRATFEKDFREKDIAIVARDPVDNTVRGFSTQVVYGQQVGDTTVRVLFSGDTIVDHRYWASNPLARLWGQFAVSLIDRFPDEPIYWFLISKGYKTYRFLPVFFHEFYPRYDRATPDWASRLISALAFARFGPRYCESKGILLASGESCRLRHSVADVTDSRLQDPHVAWFERVNPGYVRGDELCCIAPISLENFCRSAFRVMGYSSADIPRPKDQRIVGSPDSGRAESRRQ